MTKTPRMMSLANKSALTTLSIDPGFGACGYAVVRRQSGLPDLVLEMGVIKTKKASKKQRVLANEDNFMRCREIAAKLYALVNRYSVNLITFEAFSFPAKASKSNIAKMSLPYGAVAMLTVIEDFAIVMSTPQHIKKSICGRINASKKEVEEKMQQEFGEQPQVKDFMQRIPANSREHGWDALAAYVAAEHSDVMRALRKAL